MRIIYLAFVFFDVNVHFTQVPIVHNFIGNYSQLESEMPILNYPNIFTEKVNEFDTTHFIKRSTVGYGGISKTITTPDGTYNVSQSIGQASVIGTHTKNKYTILQGYQQPLVSNKKLQPSTNHLIKATIYPNPFKHTINIQFDEQIKDEIFVRLYDANARMVVLKKFAASNQISLSLLNILKGIYTIKIITGNKSFSAKLIKE